MPDASAITTALEPPLPAFRGRGLGVEVASGPLTPHLGSVWGEDALRRSVFWGLECGLAVGGLPGLRTSSEEKRLGLSGMSSPPIA